ncbi:MAG TPA: immunoglobulin domain-containing protein [Verrucomicrobiae bacterium]|jgi:hypothetical protein|nr:immunoglobulin domain-containing protein [Verrucomicrobiae bacterium]
MRTNKSLLSYFAIVLAIVCFGVQLAQATVSVVVQPQNPTIDAGTNITFLAQTSVTGGETITGYAWRMSPDDLPPFNSIPGATNATFTINSAQATNSGYYFVAVTYSSGGTNGLQAVSTVSQLIVRDIAHVIVQPVANTIAITGTNVVLSITASGATPINYQWRLNSGNLSDNGRITGSTANVLSIANALTTDSGNYDVVVANAFGSSTSHVAVVNVYAPPFVSVPPVDTAVIVSNTAVLSVVPGGSAPFTFQWFDGNTPLTDGSRISGSTNSTLTIQNARTNDDGNYSVVFSNPVGTATSAPVTLTVLIPPLITSATNVQGQQGVAFNFTLTATGSAPITFGVDSLPDGLTLGTNGLISGVPTVSGVFDTTVYATNPAITVSSNLEITLVSGVPGITSSLTNSGQQGKVFTYKITASNNPISFSAVGLPPGINLDPVSGTISGPSLVSGIYLVTIGASNPYGADSKVLTLKLASDIPGITSALTATGVENATNFTYTIKGSNAPTMFNAIGLPLGLTVNTNTGVISGPLFEGGTNKVLILAANAYGVGSNVLTLAISYAKISNLTIANVTANYSVPYLLDFTFSLQDGTNAVVRPPEQLTVQCFEGDIIQTNPVPIPTETAFIVNRSITSSSSVKQLKTMFVLDYSFSMFVSPGAISNMQVSVENLIDEEPPMAQFGVVEFSADYVAPMLVTNFTADKAALAEAINGIQTNFVQGNYGGTRFYDALTNALAQFTAATPTEDRYLITMSDGNDDSSLFASPTNTMTTGQVIAAMAKKLGVKIYCVGFGPNANTNVLMELASDTGGHYYSALSGATLSAQFGLLLKDLNSQYLLRWATLQRTGVGFQPMFTVSIGGSTADFNTDFNFVPFSTNVDTNMMPPVTNITFTNMNVPPISNFVATSWAGDVKMGSLLLVPDALTNASQFVLHAFYVPRFVRELQFHYRANYPTVPTLLSTNIGDPLNGWSLSQTNDGAGGEWLTIASPNTNDPSTSLPYGIMGDLVSFQFNPEAVTNASLAFSEFDVDNTIYSNLPPNGQTFNLTNGMNFITNYPPTPPFGTPVPWLLSYFPGATNLTDLEVTNVNGNGLPVWQDYIAGLNPLDPNAKFFLSPIVSPQAGVPMLTFPTALGRTYRVDSAVVPGAWTPLLDGIIGTGGLITIPDNRNLSGVGSLYYRVAVSYHP